MSSVPTSEVLNRAADLIEERGWAQGNDGMRVDGSPLCLEGGIAAAAGLEGYNELRDDVFVFNYFDVEACPAYVAVKTYLASRPATEYAQPFGAGEVWGWNDLSTRTQAEVVATLRAVALIEAARETNPARESAEVRG